MVDIAKVNLYGQQIGSVRWDSNLITFNFSVFMKNAPILIYESVLSEEVL